MRLKMKRKPPTGSICPSLIAALFSGLLACLSPQATTGTEDERPTILQYQQSYFLNEHEISLVFRQDAVQLVVNTDFWQKKGDAPHLGIFEAGYNRDLLLLKERVEIYQHLVTEYQPHVTESSPLLDIPGFSPEPEPHAPRIFIGFIGGEEVLEVIIEGYHEILYSIIQSAWDYQWNCVLCTTYRFLEDSIVRTRKTSDLEGSDKESQTTDEFFKPSKRGSFLSWWFEEEVIECIEKGYFGGSMGSMECLDYEFGIFYLSTPVQVR